MHNYAALGIDLCSLFGQESLSGPGVPVQMQQDCDLRKKPWQGEKDSETATGWRQDTLPLES